MYSLSDYRSMITDPVRTPAYRGAIEAAVRPGDVVTEIGAGFGYFSILACRAGAGIVHAIEPDPAIHLAPELARANGCEGRIRFIHGVSTAVSVPPADVVVSDLRGVLPLLGLHLPAIVDARERLLKPGGIQIPTRDTLRLALVRSSEPSDPPLDRDVDLGAVDRMLENGWWKQRVAPDELRSDPLVWGQVDYRTVVDPNVEGTVELAADRDGPVDGLVAWFDAELYGGFGFSNAPDAPKAIYGQAFFPVPVVHLRRGDRVRVTLRARLVGDEYVWEWRGEVLEGEARGVVFERATFHGAPLSLASLRKRADRHVPHLARAGEAELWILGRMAASDSLREISEGLAERFPDLFPDFHRALGYVADLSERFGR